MSDASQNRDPSQSSHSLSFEEQLDGMRRRLYEVEEKHRISLGNLHASQEHLRLVFENAREYAIFTMDVERRVTSWNEGAKRLLGFQENDILGRSADVIFTPEDKAEGAPLREALTALREGRASDERWHVRKDGTRFWGSGSMMAMRDAAGKTVGLLKIMRDRTSERCALEELTQARAEAEAAGEAKDRFFAVLSHELRTPLSPVVMGLESLLEEPDLSSEVKEQLEMIMRNVAVEVRLIDDLLDVTRISRNKLEIVRLPVDLHGIIHRATEVCAPDSSAKEQVLTLDLNAERKTIEGDALRLQQAIWNLLRNAIKFTPAKGAIRVSSRNEAEMLIVEVADSGCGMDQAALTHIFEAFTQADPTVGKRYGGLGLGLTISKAIVNAHGGELKAYSDGPGKGSIFTIELPVA
ncbi:MAG TPA: PAS domain-containing sensor histidine kinase [Verrucomicrobiales bacterium]|nr:PAS domain-containing sensor histidine kinase [Verrucomicrobiales bacterium]